MNSICQLTEQEEYITHLTELEHSHKKKKLLLIDFINKGIDILDQKVHFHNHKY